jgi:hypothetical protein
VHPNPGKLRRGWRGGSRRVFEQFVWLGVGSVKAALSRPTHQRVTHTVGRMVNLTLNRINCSVRSLVNREASHYEQAKKSIIVSLGGFTKRWASQISQLALGAGIETNRQHGEIEMTTLPAKTSPLVRARVAGALYLMANIFAPFTLLYLPSLFIVRGDAAATASNIIASESLFRLGIVGNLFTFIANIFLALALYQLLKVVNKNMASLMVILFLVGVPIAMLNEVPQLAVLRLLSGADYLKAYPTDQLQALAYLLLGLHDQGLLIAHIFFGLWLLPMGYLVFKSGFIPKIVGVLLVIAGVGYVIQSFAAFLGYNMNIIVFTGLGELVFLLWLLIKGVNVEQWRKHTPASA